ncbi:50S ribosomal protein P1 [Candidatus Pacearchaeota archaeon ex4484_26]|nr:MAG: 50S ribosomal protein P1 [Candidatus Pacearchaeota archaeon ex4484_26]
MEYIYAALILHKAGKKIDEDGIKRILEAAGIKPDEARIKSLIASLEGVDIGKTLEEAKAPAVAVAQPVAEAKPAEKKEEKEEKKQEAAEGLSALFA